MAHAEVRDQQTPRTGKTLAVWGSLFSSTSVLRVQQTAQDFNENDQQRLLIALPVCVLSTN